MNDRIKTIITAGVTSIITIIVFMVTLTNVIKPIEYINSPLPIVIFIVNLSLFSKHFNEGVYFLYLLYPLNKNSFDVIFPFSLIKSFEKLLSLQYTVSSIFYEHLPNCYYTTCLLSFL